MKEEERIYLITKKIMLRIINTVFIVPRQATERFKHGAKGCVTNVLDQN